MVTQELTIRLDETELPEIRMVSGDVGREIRIEVYARKDSENPIDLETYSAEITIIKPDNTFIMDNFTVNMYELPENAGAVSGNGYYQIKIFTAGTHQIYTGQGPFLVDDMILSDDVIESSSIAFGDRFPEDFATKTWVDDEIEHAGLGTYVEGNPAGDPTEPDLVKLQINDDIFPIPVPDVPETLDDLDDVDIASPSDGEVLMYDGAKWENAELPEPPTVTKTATGNPIEISDGADAPLVKCVTQITGYQSGSGTPSPDNVRPIVAYSTGKIEVSDGDGNTTTHTTTFASAIYRGSEDVVNGEVNTEWGVYTVTGAESWVKWSSYKCYYAPVGINAINNSETVNGLSECFEAVSTRSFIRGGSTGIAVNSNNIYIGEDDYMNLSALSGTKIAYRLATPTTSSVTPTNLPVKSLNGYTHIESTTGEMEVEYITQQFEPLQHLHYYSTAEQVVGKWVDGSDVKEKTFIYTGTGAANPFTATIDMTGKSIIEVIPHYAKYTYGGGSVGYCAGSKLTESNSAVLKVEYDDATPPTVNVTSYLGSSTETYEIAFTIRYI